MDTDPNTQPDILVVEDDFAIREAIAELLTEHGYLVDRVADGAAALEKLRAGLRPSLLVLDLTMPVMSGWQLCRELGRDAELAAIPVILMSAGSTPPPRPAALVGFFRKPLDIPGLLEAVRAGVGAQLARPAGTRLATADFRRASCS